jgi:pimeloyl-ACP methyl ester carboxylesterase
VPAEHASPPAPDGQIIETSLGPVEYARVGTGDPVLVLHGSPGGLDAAALMARFLPQDEVSAILISRPGYLGTRLDGRRTIDEQADLFAALFDALDVPRAGVISWSGGGPCSYRFAVRHPDRVSALVAFAGVSKEFHANPLPTSARLLMTTAVGIRLMRVLAKQRPRDYVTGTLKTESNLRGAELKARVDEVLNDPVKRAFVLDLGPTAALTRDRRGGYDNDLDQFAAIESLELERISTPTLVIQGSADSDVPPDHSEYAASTIPGARLIVLDRGSHLALYTHPDAEATQREVIDFLRSGRG